MKKLAMIVLVITALGYTAAPPAHAWSEFTKHLASKSCSDKNTYFKNGCYAYIEPRLKAKSTSEALKWCKENRCNSWFSYKSAREKCYQGCTYLYKMGE